MGRKRSVQNAQHRVAIVSLGCAKNLVDSEHIGSLLEEAGVPKYRLCKKPGGTVRYRPEDIEEFLNESREEQGLS